MCEVKAGQKYRRLGDWLSAKSGGIVEVEAVESNSRHDYVALVGGPRSEPSPYFFPSQDSFLASGYRVGYVLVEEPEEEKEDVQEENNQLSPNVYQFPNGVEVKDISAHLTSFGGQAVQYIARATRLDGVVKGLPVQDLYKAIELLKWEAERMEALQK